jgi:hypothetical protein
MYVPYLAGCVFIFKRLNFRKQDLLDIFIGKVLPENKLYCLQLESAKRLFFCEIIRHIIYFILQEQISRSFKYVSNLSKGLIPFCCTFKNLVFVVVRVIAQLFKADSNLEKWCSCSHEPFVFFFTKRKKLLIFFIF